MTHYNNIASSDIRKYIWQAIQDAEILDPHDYYADGFSDLLIPIIPTQQVPEFNNLLPGKTYMIFDWEVRTVPVQWWMTEESFTLSVVSQNYDVLNQITNLVHDLFRRYDESAVDLNNYLAGDTNFIYHHTMIDSIMSPEPFNSEGDYQIASVMFTYNYSRLINNDGRFAGAKLGDYSSLEEELEYEEIIDGGTTIIP